MAQTKQVRRKAKVIMMFGTNGNLKFVCEDEYLAIQDTAASNMNHDETECSQLPNPPPHLTKAQRPHFPPNTRASPHLWFQAFTQSFPPNLCLDSPMGYFIGRVTVCWTREVDVWA